jgi:ribosomal-protein-alanine N-acetyltransferase
MTDDDIPEVLLLERASFSSPWTEYTFRVEISRNERAFYFVLRSSADGASTGSLAQGETRGPLPPILAYGGYWVLGDEAHIVTIASHPMLRRHGFGELMFLHLIDRAREAAITSITLEVRAGNTPAQGLYTKYGFKQVGLRKQYYRDNNEDALLMTLYDVDKPAVWEPLAAALAALERDFERRARERMVIGN